MAIVATIGHFDPLLGAWGPFNPTKSVPEAAKPLSFDNRGMKIISALMVFDVDLLVFFKW